MVFKMEDSGLLSPRNSGLVRAPGGRAGLRQECGRRRRADPEPQEREGPWAGKKLFGTRSRSLASVQEPPPHRSPRKHELLS